MFSSRPTKMRSPSGSSTSNFRNFTQPEDCGVFYFSVVNRNDAPEERKFTKQYVNEPRWGESLRMLAEDIAERGAKAQLVEAGARLVRMALHVDPIFAAALANASGPAVWAKVREDVGKRLRAWYA